MNLTPRQLDRTGLEFRSLVLSVVVLCTFSTRRGPCSSIAIRVLVVLAPKTEESFVQAVKQHDDRGQGEIDHWSRHDQLDGDPDLSPCSLHPMEKVNFTCIKRLQKCDPYSGGKEVNGHYHHHQCNF